MKISHLSNVAGFSPLYNSPTFIGSVETPFEEKTTHNKIT